MPAQIGDQRVEADSADLLKALECADQNQRHDLVKVNARSSTGEIPTISRRSRQYSTKPVTWYSILLFVAPPDHGRACQPAADAAASRRRRRLQPCGRRETQRSPRRRMQASIRSLVLISAFGGMAAGAIGPRGR
jgi:hypothetical protein